MLKGTTKTMFLNTETMQWTNGPKMNYPRVRHGCTTIPSNANRKAQIIVVGGHWKSRDIEVLGISNSSWINVAKIPIENLNDNTVTASNSKAYKMYSIGGVVENGRVPNYINAIYGLTHSNELKLVGNLTEGRSRHTSLNVDPNGISGCF